MKKMFLTPFGSWTVWIKKMFMMMQGTMVISFIQRIYMCSPYYTINIYVYKQPPCTPLSTSWPPSPPPLPTSALTWDLSSPTSTTLIIAHHPQSPSLLSTTYYFQPIITYRLLLTTNDPLPFTSEWQKLCEGTKGLRQKVWTWTKILSPNILSQF